MKWLRACLAGTACFVAGFPALAQVAAPERLAAPPPITGVLWTVVLPILLFGVSFWAAYALYRRFSK